jgi:hypothetical protein
MEEPVVKLGVSPPEEEAGRWVVPVVVLKGEMDEWGPDDVLQWGTAALVWPSREAAEVAHALMLKKGYAKRKPE